MSAYRQVSDKRFLKLQKFLDYILQWQAEAKLPKKIDTLSHETITGIEMTVNSFIKCTQFLLEKGACFIMPRVFCQDPLQQYFSKQRAACGGSTNPNFAQFLSRQDKIVQVGNLGFKRKRGNTEYISDPKNLERLCAPLTKRPKVNLVSERTTATSRKRAAMSTLKAIQQQADKARNVMRYH